jgi:hypothetical protein
MGRLRKQIRRPGMAQPIWCILIRAVLKRLVVTWRLWQPRSVPARPNQGFAT